MKGFEQNYELEKITKEYRDYALLIGDAVLNYTYGQKMEIKGDTVLSRYDNNGEITYRTGLLTPVGAIGGMFSFFALPDGIRLIDENGLPMDSRNISVKTSFRIEADKEDALEGKKLKLIYSCPIPTPALVHLPIRYPRLVRFRIIMKKKAMIREIVQVLVLAPERISQEMRICLKPRCRLLIFQ